MKKLQKEKLYEYFLLAAQLLLVYVLIDYGWAKLTGDQFGVSQKILNMQLKDINMFQLSWYLADHQPFKTFVGMMQIVTALFLFFRKTIIIGALMSIPIWLNILVWDITYIGFYSMFTIRISYYLLLTFLILWQHKNRLVPAIQASIEKSTPKFRYPIWALCLLPLAMMALELVCGFPNVISYIFKHI